ncbi:MAG: aminodeoxychorismate synthase component I, partial [Acidobacteria bacterium]|nr:aminodeoxychorismate synthase component I [Acidobacteriota bacterium]
MIRQHFLARFSGSRAQPSWNGQFQKPGDLALAHTLDEVRPVLGCAAEAARRGKWAVVLLSYNAAPAFDSALVVRPPVEDGLPLACVAVFDGPDFISPPGDAASAELRHSPALRRLSDSSAETSRQLEGISADWQHPLPKGEYAAALACIQEYIRAGDVYQVNYTFPLIGRFTGDPVAWFRHLAARQPAAFHAYIEFGRFLILSFSPELFFTRHGEQITVRPMKGTCPRGRWIEEDRRQAERLLASEKDRAENLMIVDLLRNDLGRLAIPGSVRVTKLFSLERHPTLWQMTSTIRALARPETGLEESLAALLPCGSVTGAPKVRAMQIIAELESWPRGLYTGAIGLVRPGGDCMFAVAIRTLVLDTTTGQAIYGVGSGVTHDSEISSEYAECRLKSAFLMPVAPSAQCAPAQDHQTLAASTTAPSDALPSTAWDHPIYSFYGSSDGFDLLETIRLSDGRYYLLPEHFRRLRGSAEYFGFVWRPGQIRAALARLRLPHAHGRWRVRLTLNAAGEPDLKVQPMPPADSDRWRLGMAPFPVDSADPMLYHKTTQR